MQMQSMQRKFKIMLVFSCYISLISFNLNCFFYFAFHDTDFFFSSRAQAHYFVEFLNLFLSNISLWLDSGYKLLAEVPQK